MGNGTSSDTAIFALDPFVGTVALHEDDVLLEEMLCARIGAEHVSHADEILDSLCSQLTAHNPHTRNFQKLMRIVLRKTRALRELSAAELAEDGGPAYAVANALFISRVFLRALIQRQSDDLYAMRAAHLQMPGDVVDDADGGLLGEIFRALVDVLIDVPRSPATLPLLTEACLVCQTALSVQMFASLDDTPVGLLASTLTSPYRAEELAHALLAHHVYAPAPAPLAAVDGGAAGAGAGAYGDARARRWGLLPALLFVPRQLIALLFSSSGPSTPPPTLHSASLCLLLLLVQDLPRGLRPHGRDSRTAVARQLGAIDDDLTSGSPSMSSTRAAAAAADLELSGGGGGGGLCSCGVFPLPRLFEAICAQLPAEPQVLLLHHLLHTNRGFLRYALSRTDVDALLVPLLRGLYACGSAKGAPARARVYLLLIVLLVLSQDAPLMRAAFALSVARVPWYRERLLGPISVGSLLVCVLCRVVHANLSSALWRDAYVTSTCIALLANVAPHHAQLHAHAAQSLVSLYARLARRHAALVIRRGAQAGGGDAAAGASAPVAAEQEAEQAAVLDAMRTLLEAINAALTASIVHNARLVYAILERAHLFPPHAHAAPSELGDVLANVGVVVAFFAPRVASAGGASASDGGGAELVLPSTAREAAAAGEAAAAAAQRTARTVSEAMTALDAAAAEWDPSLLAPMPALRFTYEQEPECEEFFTPYLWALVSQTMSLVDDGARDDDGAADVGAVGAGADAVAAGWADSFGPSLAPTPAPSPRPPPNAALSPPPPPGGGVHV